MIKNISPIHIVFMGDDYDEIDYGFYLFAWNEYGFRSALFSIVYDNPRGYANCLFGKWIELGKPWERYDGDDLVLVDDDDDDDYDEHLGCASYPNCDERGLGCRVRHGANAEMYGHRD